MPDPTPINKVRYGLKNVHYATVTFGTDGTPTYATPVAIPGAVNLSLSRSGSTVNFYADDDVYFEISDNSGMDGNLEIALIPESFRTSVLGEVADSKNVLFENAEATLGHFALLFEFDGDVSATRHVLYNCTATQNALAGKTRGENLEVETETLNLKARPLPNGGALKAKTGDEVDSTTYSNWYSAVHLYTAAS